MIVFKIHNNNNKKEYWRGLPFPSLVDFPDPRFKPLSLESPALAVGFFTTVPPRKPVKRQCQFLKSQGSLICSLF